MFVGVGVGIVIGIDEDQRNSTPIPTPSRLICHNYNCWWQATPRLRGEKGVLRNTFVIFVVK